jgi:hypothetical protein
LTRTYSISIEDLYESVTEFWTKDGTIEPPNPTNLKPPPLPSFTVETFDPSEIIRHFGLQSSYRHSRDIAKFMCFVMYARAHQTSAGGLLQYSAGSTSWHLLGRTFNPELFHCRFGKIMDAISQGVVQKAMDIADTARKGWNSLVTNTRDHHYVRTPLGKLRQNLGMSPNFEEPTPQVAQEGHGVWNLGTPTHQGNSDVVVSVDEDEEHEILFITIDSDINDEPQDVFALAFQPTEFEDCLNKKQDKHEQPLSYVPVLRGDITESHHVMTPSKISPAPRTPNVPPPTPTNARSSGPPPTSPQGRRTDDRSPSTALPSPTLQGSQHAGRPSSPTLQGRRTDGQPRFWASPLPGWQMLSPRLRHHHDKPWDPGRIFSPLMLWPSR